MGVCAIVESASVWRVILGLFEVAVAAVLIGKSVDVRLLSAGFHLLLLCAVKRSVSWGITIG